MNKYLINLLKKQEKIKLILGNLNEVEEFRNGKVFNTKTILRGIKKVL